MNQTDPNVESVRAKLLQRSQVGIKKYGCTTAQAGLTRLQWLRHAQEEALDLAVYLEQLIDDEVAPQRIPDDESDGFYDKMRSKGISEEFIQGVKLKVAELRKERSEKE